MDMKNCDNEILREQLSLNSFSLTSTAFRIGLFYSQLLYGLQH